MGFVSACGGGGALATQAAHQSGPHMAKARPGNNTDESSLKGARILVVEARFYDDIADTLLAEASSTMSDLEHRDVILTH